MLRSPLALDKLRWLHTLPYSNYLDFLKLDRQSPDLVTTQDKRFKVKGGLRNRVTTPYLLQAEFGVLGHSKFEAYVGDSVKM